MIIQHNIMAMSAYRNYMGNTNALSKNLEKLSSGYRINRAGDDAAGLAISEKMRAQITGLDAAQKNVQDGISLVQTAEGALQEVQDMLNRMVYLATQSANGTYDNEVDRANLQKEVDALSTEIDRIADSSNFNGIKLLDGSLGMNTEAISVANKGAVEASDGALDVSELFGNFHVESNSVSAVQDSAVSFTLDFSGLSLDAGGATSGSHTLTLNFGGESFELTLAHSAAYFGGSAELAAGALAALQADTDTKVATNVVKFGDFAFNVTADTGADGTNSALKFTLAGKPNTAGSAAVAYSAAAPMSEADAAAINALMQDEFTVEFTAAAGKNSSLQGEQLVHDVTEVTQAVAGVEGELAGIELEITEDMVVDGGKITIDGKDITFDFDASTAAPGTIALEGFEEGSAEAIAEAVAQLSQQTVTGKDGRSFEIGKTNDTTIHIDQVAPTTAGKAKLDTEAALKAVITANGAPTTAANASTTITLNKDKLVEGNTVTVDGKSFVFSKDPASVEGGTGVDINNAVADLAAKLTEAGFNATADAEKGTVTLEAADAESSAPVVLGKGLALQIGDTADNFNQLAVSVEDMHVDALGIGDIDISTQEGASVAIDKIKSAINSVSMTRGTLGATQNRLEHTANNLSVMEENIQDAESSIRDTDIAEEMMAYTKNNILIQSAQAMLAQANTIPQGVLQLLG